MSKNMFEDLRKQIQDLHEQGLYKSERVLRGPQQAHINILPPEAAVEAAVEGGAKPEAEHEVINFCANNYLGLSNHPEIIE
ncbi:MAG: hypothetical protein ACLFM6_01865, partial [Spirochaetaceae bacterium]